MSGWQCERWMGTPSAECSANAGRLCAAKKRSRQTPCLLEDCSLRARKVLRDHVSPYHERISQARNASNDDRAPASCVREPRVKCETRPRADRSRPIAGVQTILYLFYGPDLSAISYMPYALFFGRVTSTGVLRARDGTALPWGEPVRRSPDSGASWLLYGSRRRRRCVHLA